MSDPVLIRDFNPAVRGEENYIKSTWLRDLRDADPSGLPDDLWFPAHRRHIETVLGDPRATILIAATSDDPHEILGYLVTYPEYLEWVHVRKLFREQGLAKRLLQAAHATPEVPSRWTTPLARQRLLNKCRSRQIRSSGPPESRGIPAPSSASPGSSRRS